MNLEEMPHLTTDERWVYVIGRITVESVDMDAKLRTLRSALANENGRDAILAAAPAWNATLTSCRALLAGRPLDERGREAIGLIFDAADAAWQQRNRYVHDLLVDTIQADEVTAPVVPGYRRGNRRLRRRLSRDRNGVAPVDEIVHLNHAVDLVRELVAVVWRVEAAHAYIEGSTLWNDMIFGQVTGYWDGSADVDSDEDEDEDEDD